MELPEISESLVMKFTDSAGRILDRLNAGMVDRPDIEKLIGGPEGIQVMLENHRNHISFISIVIRLNQVSLLEKTLPWVYQSYHSQGFSYDYFTTVLRAWKEAVRQIITDEDPAAILELYDRMIDMHSKNIEAAERLNAGSVSDELTPVQLEFLDALVAGDQRQVFRLTDSYMTSGSSLESFYLDLVQPAMHSIGRKWERGEISVANEHLASAMLARIMASFYQYVNIPEITKGKILISSAANEYHEIGAWMTANVFELRGWDVYYLGTNTPVRDLVSILKTFKPDILGLSVTMAYNLKSINTAIEQIRSEADLAGVKILLGGNLFAAFPELKKLYKVDYIAASFIDALEFAEKSYGNKQPGA